MYKLQLSTILIFALLSMSCADSKKVAQTTDSAESVDSNQISDTATSVDSGVDELDDGTTQAEVTVPLSPLSGPCETTENCAPIGEIGTVCINNQLIGGLGIDVEADIPNGYCSNMTCKASEDCGEGLVQCIDLKASGENIPFNVCVKGCAEGSSECLEGQQCYCDEDQGIFNTEGQADFCSCLPDLLIELITGG